MTTTSATMPGQTHPTTSSSSTADRSAAAPVFHRSHTEEPGYGRSIVFATIVGAVTVLLLVGGGMVLSGAAHADALGIGIFAALWGGVGFGVMVGGVVQAQRLELALLPATASTNSSAATSTASLSEWPSTTSVPARARVSA